MVQGKRQRLIVIQLIGTGKETETVIQLIGTGKVRDRG